MTTAVQIDPRRVENLGPAERVINALLTHADHAVHNRPGVVVPDGRTTVGFRWDPAVYREEGPEGGPKVRVAYRLSKNGKKNVKTKIGILGEDDQVRDERGNVVASYRWPGVFPEVVAWMWRQIAEVWKLDNEFSAHWASHAFTEDHKDLKVALAAFMLVQSRRGEPVRENGEVIFFDDDFRDVGEAMCHIRRSDGKDLNPRLLLRIHDFLTVPQVAEINRELGFGVSTRNPTLGRWPKVVTRWLMHREQNPKLLQGLVKAGMRTTVMELARRVGYTPVSSTFFSILRWEQKQRADGRRTVAIGEDVKAAETWEGLNEAQVCQKLIDTKPSWKRATSLIPESIGVTRAIMAAAVQAGCLSDNDLIIMSPTLEDFGLTNVEPVKSRWEAAIKNAENQRAQNILTKVRKQETVEKLQEASDNAVKKVVEEAVKGLMVYFFVDTSGSMQHAIEQAKKYLAQFLQGFPLEKIRVAVFNTSGRELTVKHNSATGVNQAFQSINAGGGTDYGAGVLALQRHRPEPGEDALFIFVGDEQATDFHTAVRASGLNPVAFGLLKLGNDGDRCVRNTAAALNIPCFKIDEGIFSDPYAITRTLRNLIAATPVRKDQNWNVPVLRVSLVEKILKTPLLARPLGYGKAIARA